MQTAVIWFYEQIKQYILTHGNLPFNVLSEIKKQVIKMEEQQIIKAAARGYLIGEDNLPLEDAKDFGLDYYNSTYGSKGSDEHIVDTNEMVCYTKQDVIDAIIKIHEIYSLHGQYNDTLEAKKLRLKGVSWHIQNILESLKKDKI